MSSYMASLRPACLTRESVLGTVAGSSLYCDMEMSVRFRHVYSYTDLMCGSEFPEQAHCVSVGGKRPWSTRLPEGIVSAIRCREERGHGTRAQSSLSVLCVV